MPWSRRLCVVASALLVLVAVADATLQTAARPRVMGALARLAGERVSAARLRIGPLGGVHLRGLQAGTALRVARLDLDLDLGALLEGRVRPTRVTAAGVRWEAAEGAAAPRSWRDRAGLGRGEGGGPAGRGAVALSASDIEVVYRGLAHEGRLRVDRLEGDLDAAALRLTARAVTARSGPWQAQADAVQVHGLSALAPPIRIELTGGIAGLGGHPVAEALAGDLRLDAGGGELRLAGHAPGDGAAQAATIALTARFGEDGGEGRVEAHAFPLVPLTPLLRPSGVLPERARVEAEVAVRWRGPLRAASDVGAAGRVAVSDLGLRHPRLAAREVTGITATLEGSARLNGDAIEVDRAVLRAGAVQSLVRVSLAHLGGTPRMTVDASLNETPCQDLVAALPPGLAPALRGLELGGRLSASAHVGIDWARLSSIEHTESIDARGCRVVRDAPGADVSALRGSFPHHVTDAAGRPRDFPVGPSNPSFRPLARMSRHVVSAFLTAEDRQFWRHGGFDPAMLGRALGHDLAVGRIEKGASTITQQLAKNLFLTPDRTIGRKLEEAVIAWRLEQLLPKQRILELYLNVIELGPGVYGVAEAAQHYFGKDPARLQPLEAAHLAALAPNPKLFARRIEAVPGEREKWLDHLRDLLGMMARSHRLTPEEAQAAMTHGLHLRPQG
jgi:hypothetical protein